MEQKREKRSLKKTYQKESWKKSNENLQSRSFKPQDIGTREKVVEKYDLVCWMAKDEMKKGLVAQIIEVGEDAKQIIDEIPVEFFSVKRKFIGTSISTKNRCLVKELHTAKEEYYYNPALRR
jgi:hypothetical protein